MFWRTAREYSVSPKELRQWNINDFWSSTKMLPRIKAEDRLEDLRIMFTAAASVQSGSGDSIESLDKQYRSILGVVFQHKAKRSPKADIISFLESANSGKE